MEIYRKLVYPVAVWHSLKQESYLSGTVRKYLYIYINVCGFAVSHVKL